MAQAAHKRREGPPQEAKDMMGVHQFCKVCIWCT
jgi:hypothetical protein